MWAWIYTALEPLVASTLGCMQKKLRKLSSIIEQSICDILLQQQQHENSTAVQAGQAPSPFELAMPPPPPPIQKHPKFVKRITSSIASAMRRLTGRSKQSLGPVVTPGNHSLQSLSHTLYTNNLAAKKAAMHGEGPPSANMPSPRTAADGSMPSTSVAPGQDAMPLSAASGQPQPTAAPAAGVQSHGRHSPRDWAPPGPAVHATNSVSQAYAMPAAPNHQPTSSNSVSQATPMSDLSTPLHLHINKSPHWSQVPSSDGMQPMYPPNAASLTNSQASASKPHVSAGHTRVLAGGLSGAAGMVSTGQDFTTHSSKGGDGHNTMVDLPSGDSVALAGPPSEMQVRHHSTLCSFGIFHLDVLCSTLLGPFTARLTCQVEIASGALLCTR